MKTFAEDNLQYDDKHQQDIAPGNRHTDTLDKTIDFVGQRYWGKGIVLSHWKLPTSFDKGRRVDKTAYPYI